MTYPQKLQQNAFSDPALTSEFALVGGVFVSRIIAA